MKGVNFTVSGPGTDRKVESPGHGLSLATTLALRANAETTFYVRDPKGEAVGRVERDPVGNVRTWRYPS